MKIVETVVIFERGEFAQSEAWKEIRKTIYDAVQCAEWPVGSGSFVIHPESGKKSGQGNGVVPIKLRPMEILKENGWQLEHSWRVAEKTATATKRKKGTGAGDIDAAKQFEEGLVVVEWETGNVSSSHRAINKMALGLVQEKAIAGVLILPNMNLARYLTDRIGNIEEIKPYVPLWQNLSVANGVLELFVIEQDAESINVPKIPKGKDGRAKEGASAVAQLIAEKHEDELDEE